MKPTLQFRLSQHLTLTPQLQQSIRLLQLSTVELNQEIERMLMENPILEREDAEDGLTASTNFTGAQEAPGPTEPPLETAPETPEPQGDDWQPDYSAPPRTSNDDVVSRMPFWFGSATVDLRVVCAAPPVPSMIIGRVIVGAKSFR